MVDDSGRITLLEPSYKVYILYTDEKGFVSLNFLDCQLLTSLSTEVGYYYSNCTTGIITG